MRAIETFLEALSRIPGLGFLETYSKQSKMARGTMRSHRERAEELGGFVGDAKGAAGGGGNSGKPDKVQSTGGVSTTPARDIRAQARRRDNDAIDTGKTPRKTGTSSLDNEARSKIRDISPSRDGGRSLRKRKDSL
ncbi:MAG: hypothetical protein O7G85_02245 [Planctomycetota bacterium]|nr:hypothetical protein [Planctomycetota bacterium]